MTDHTAIRYIVTSDHGFIYKRDKLHESDKIDGLNCKDNFVNKRFILSGEPIRADGIECLGFSTILGNDDTKSVTVPAGANIFKAPGGGQNYVHGGASPQEMLIPVIDVKTLKGHMETKPVTDVIKATTYKLFFISEDNEKISN